MDQSPGFVSCSVSGCSSLCANPCCNMWSPLSWKPLQVMQNCIYMLLGAGFTAPSLPSASMLLFRKAYSDKSTSWCVVSYPQPPRRALWSSECWDCCRNHLIQAGRHGLHHLDLLLQTADDESQVSPAHTHTPVHSVDTAWLLLWCVVQPNICYVDRAHSRTFQPVGNCTPVIPHLPLTEAQQWHCNPAGLWVQMISGFKLGFWVSVHISERLWSVAAFICCHLLQTVGTQLRLCASLTAALLTSLFLTERWRSGLIINVINSITVTKQPAGFLNSVHSKLL